MKVLYLILRLVWQLKSLLERRSVVCHKEQKLKRKAERCYQEELMILCFHTKSGSLILLIVKE